MNLGQRDRGLAGDGIVAGELLDPLEEEVDFQVGPPVLGLLDGEIARAPAGTSVSIPARVPHGWSNRSNAPLRMLATFTPGVWTAYGHALRAPGACDAQLHGVRSALEAVQRLFLAQGMIDGDR